VLMYAHEGGSSVNAASRGGGPSGRGASIVATSVAAAIGIIPLAALAMEGLVMVEVVLETLAAMATTTHHQ
jgi:hypothetical protein